MNIELSSATAATRDNSMNSMPPAIISVGSMGYMIAGPFGLVRPGRAVVPHWRLTYFEA